MKKIPRAIAGILFLAVAVVVISLVRINPPTSTPTRSTQAREAGIIKGLEKEIVVIQEIVARKGYLAGVELIFTHKGRNNTSENLLLILDEKNNILYRYPFSSTIVKEGDFTHFEFEQPVAVGRGKSYKVVLFSPDGTPDNCISPLFNRADSIGPLRIALDKTGDLQTAVANPTYTFPGSLMMRTFGSQYSQNWLVKMMLYLVALILAVAITFYPWIRQRLIRVQIRPEWVFLLIALPGSLVFTFITPPLQVPDEASHFFKSYNIADFKVFDREKTVPVSVLELDSAFSHLRRAAGQKTTIEEITAHLGDRLSPGLTAVVSPPDYVLPYVPQALGMLVGKMLGLSPLLLMYLGRIFNLALSVIILFYAIRLVPQFKWIFVLLALMPKTVFLFGSLSYDTLTISLTFFAIALFLHYAFTVERPLGIRDLLAMAGVTGLLLLCKPPYFAVGLLFFFIPPKKFGKLYRYLIGLIAVAGLAIIVFLAIRLSTQTSTPAAAPPPLTSLSDSLAPGQSLFMPDVQMQVIRNDIPAYLELIFRSGFVKTREYILESFVGLLGYIDVELPALMTYSYLALLLAAALVLSGAGHPVGITKRALLVLILLFGYIIIETAMFLYATRPGRDLVYGVQGRYFIPLAPLFFMLFYNRWVNPRLNILFSLRRMEYRNAKAKAKPAIYEEITLREQIFNKFFHIFITVYCLFTLLYSVYITLIRYYNA